MTLPSEDNLLSISKSSSLLNVSSDTLRRLEEKGQVTPKRGVNGERLYSADDISLLKQVLKKPVSKRSYGIQETANILHVSPQTIRRWEREGKIATSRTPGGTRFFSLKDIQMLQNPPKTVRTQAPTPEPQIPTPTPQIPTPVPQTPAPVEKPPEIALPVLPFILPVKSIVKKRKNYVPYIIIIILILLLGSTVAYIDRQTYLKSTASNGIEANLPIPSPSASPSTNNPAQQVATTISNISNTFKLGSIMLRKLSSIIFRKLGSLMFQKPGSIIFLGAGSQFAEDNNNLFWNATNAFLGIGTNLPNARLTVSGGVTGVSLVELIGQDSNNILSATSNGQQVFNIDHAGNTQIAGALSDINDSWLNVLQNLAVGGDLTVAGGDITSSNDLRIYSTRSTTLGSSSSDITFKNSVLTNSIKLSSTATALPNSNTGIVDAINDAWNRAGSIWGSGGGTIRPNSATDNFAIGGSDASAPFFVWASSGNIKVAGTTSFGGVTYAWPSSQGAINSVLTNNGAGTLVWNNPTGGSGVLGFWQRTSGSLAPTNITDSLNLGAIATSSALIHLAGTAGENSFFNTGNVGIGTTAPSKKLHLYSANTDSQALIETDLGTSTLLLDGYRTASTFPVGNMVFSNNGDSVAVIASYIENSNQDSGNLTFFTQPTGGSATARMLITSTGNVGIGTTNPAYGLDVNGTARFVNNISLSSGASIIPLVSGGSDLGTSLLKFNNLYVNTINASSGVSTSGQAVFSYAPASSAISEGSVYINPTTAVAARPLLSLAVGGVEKARLTTDGYLGLGGANDPGSTYILNAGSIFNVGTNGNVGIGVTNPSATLSVGTGSLFQVAGATGNITTAGNLYVNGDNINADGTLVVLGATGLTLQATTGTITLDSIAASQIINVGASNVARTVNIGTGTGIDTIHIGDGATGADVITIGGGVGTLAIDTGSWDVSTTGAVTGAASFNGLVVTANTGAITGGSWAASLIPLAYGGTNKNMTAVNGGIVWTNATNMEVSAAGVAGQVLTSGGAGAPTWSDPAGLGVKWSSLLSPTANLALTMGAYTSTFTYNATTGAGVNLFNLTDTNSNTGTGYMMNLTTGTSSALHPLHVAAGGVEALTVDTNGYVGIGTTTPNYKLEVNGSVNIPTGNTYKVNGVDVIGLWAAYGSDIANTNAGNVGIGTTTPNSKLDIRQDSDSALTMLRIFNTQGADGSINEEANIEMGLAGVNQRGQQGVLLRAGKEGDYDSDGGTNASVDSFFAINTVQNDAYNERFRVTSSGNVGIGTTSPGARLDIRDTTGGEIVRINNASGGTGSNYLAFYNGATRLGYVGFGAASNDMILMTDSATGSLRLGAGGSSQSVWIKYDGNVGIGTTSPSTILSVVQTSATDPIADAWTTYSSGRWKENQSPIADALGKINLLNPVYFDWKKEYGGKHDFGFIAEEVGQIVPEVVAWEDNGVDAKSIDYARLSALSIAGIKEQQIQIASISGQLASLLQGACVTGDTLLPIRRKRKAKGKRQKAKVTGGDGDDDFDYLLCRIDNILPGDEVLSLNEATGALEHARINALKDMGEKEVWELVTKSGRRIRTTANHPYLTEVKS